MRANSSIIGIGPHGRRATTMIWSIVSMVTLMAFISLAVDLGRVQLVKTELRRAADAAARYGVSGLSTGTLTAQNNALAAASDNTADGSTVTLNSSTDVDFGNWDTSSDTFTVLTGAARANANAMRITARRTGATGNAVPLLFAKVLGMSFCDVTAQSIAMLTKPPAFTGTGGITFHTNTFIASYNSSVNPIPGTTSFNSNGTFGSNGAILGTGTSNILHGSVVLGSSGSVSGITVTGTTTTGGTIESLAEPVMTVVSNPSGVSQTPNVSGTVTWSGGTYYFTSLQMAANANIFFTGPATIELNGSATLNDNNYIVPYNYVPKNLTFEMASGNTFTAHNGLIMGAAFIAPSGTFTMNDSGYYGGSIFTKQINMHDSCELFSDEALAAQTTSISMTK